MKEREWLSSKKHETEYIEVDIDEILSDEIMATLKIHDGNKTLESGYWIRDQKDQSEVLEEIGTLLRVLTLFRDKISELKVPEKSEEE